MYIYAIKLLIGDRAKYIGILMGLTFASFIISQQMAIFLGVMERTYGFIIDTSQPNIWVTDPKVQHIDDIKPLKDTQLFRIRGIEGVKWAVPLYKGLLKARLRNGTFQICNVIGIDNSTLIGGPAKMLEGHLSGLRNVDAIIVDDDSAMDKLASPINGTSKKKVPLAIGDVLEINDNRAVIVGFCRVFPTFQTQPTIYTTFTRAISFAPPERKLLSFVLAHSQEGVAPEKVCKRIEETTGLAAYTDKQFIRLTIEYYMKETGIPINFGVSVILGFVIGMAIAGQTFYNFTLDNIRYFGTFKAMGAPDKLLTRMIFLQALVVGGIGYGIGVGATALFGIFSHYTELAFKMPWQLFVGSAISILIIIIMAAFLSLRKVYTLEPAIVFKS